MIVKVQDLLNATGNIRTQTYLFFSNSFLYNTEQPHAACHPEFKNEKETTKIQTKEIQQVYV